MAYVPTHLAASSMPVAHRQQGVSAVKLSLKPRELVSSVESEVVVMDAPPFYGEMARRSRHSPLHTVIAGEPARVAIDNANAIRRFSHFAARRNAFAVRPTGSAVRARRRNIHQNPVVEICLGQIIGHGPTRLVGIVSSGRRICVGADEGNDKCRLPVRPTIAGRAAVWPKRRPHRTVGTPMAKSAGTPPPIEHVSTDIRAASRAAPC